MNAFLFWMSVFVAVLTLVYFVLFIRLTFRLCTDCTLPVHVHVKLDDRQLEQFCRKIK